jgi:hypothetical protein
VRHLLALALIAALASPTAAQAARLVDQDDLEIDFGGDVKGLFDVAFPYEHLFMPEDPLGRAAVDFRLKLDGRYRFFSWSFHHQATALIRTPGYGSLGIGSTATAPPSPIDMSWSALDTDGFALQGRVDRLVVRFHAPHLDVAIGRQPISFGTGFFFTPMDLVAVYAPSVVDREYKPGVDATRLDFWIGNTGHITVVAALTGDFDLDGLLIAAHGGFTVGLFDLGFFAAKVHDDAVFGFDTSGSLGPVGVHSDFTVTVPKEDDVFIRAMIGANILLPENFTISGELYGQSVGALHADDYMDVARLDRFERGELWTMGHFYGALALNKEVTPLIYVNLSAIVNFLDPSMLLGPGFTWSIANNVTLAAGGFFAIGERPEELEIEDLLHDDFTPFTEDEVLDAFEPNSEFGLMPHQAYLQINAYF